MLAGSMTAIVAATTVVATSSASAGTPPAAPSGFITTFSDNFAGAAGSAPNSANWFYDEGTGFGTGEIETMTNSTANCSLDGNGDLKLTAIESGTSWTSCRLESQLDNFYAVPGGQMIMEASVEQPNPASGDGLGYWPAFWSLGSPGRAGGGWPTEGEIDMSEDVNGLNESSQTLHDAGGGPGHALIACPTSGCQTSFNTYEVLINRVNTSAEYLEFIMDGTVEDTITEASVGTTDWQDAIDHGYDILWDLAMGGNYPNGECDCTTPTSATTSGLSMLANWVAVYQTATSAGQNCNGYQGAGCNASPGTATATGTITQGGNCMTNNAGNDTEGNPINVEGCNGSASQSWSLLSNGNITVSGACLDVVAAGTTDGTDIDYYPCNGTAAQNWTVEANGELDNPNSGLCLTNPGTGDQLELEGCTAAADQIWKVPSGGTGTTTTTTTGPTTTTTASTTTTTKPTTTTTGVTTTTVPGSTNCSASTSGETALSESGWTGSSSTPSSEAGAQYPISNVIAGTSSGRFTSGADEAVGDQWEANMGAAKSFNEVELSVPDYNTDYPRGFNVEVSSNGSTWTTVASCTASATPEIVSFPAQSDQYVQIVLTAANPSYWWSMEYFYVYSNGTSGTTTTTVASTTTTKATTTTTAPTTTTTAGTVNCSASTSGQTQLNESAYTASVSDMPAATGVQTPITQAVSHTDSSRFTSGAESASGMTYEVNMGSAQTVDEIDMYVPDYAGDYPRGYNVEVSTNGTSWTTVASCTATAQPTIVSFPAHTDQYLQVVLTAGSTGSWWSMEQFLMYT
jgi:hypothetical protein